MQLQRHTLRLVAKSGASIPGGGQFADFDTFGPGGAVNNNRVEILSHLVRSQAGLTH